MSNGISCISNEGFEVLFGLLERPIASRLIAALQLPPVIDVFVISSSDTSVAILLSAASTSLPLLTLYLLQTCSCR